jgi:hypothetical protein
MKPSPYTEINQSITTLISFIKDNVKTGVVEFSRAENLDVSDNDLRKLMSAVEKHIDASFTNGYSNVQKCLSKLDIK